MSAQYVADALQRVEVVLRRRPDMGLHDDAPAPARWHGGTRIVARHANGTRSRPTCPASWAAPAIK